MDIEVIKEKLVELEDRISKLEGSDGNSLLDKNNQEVYNTDGFIKKLCNDAEITEYELMHIFHIENDNIEIVYPFKGMKTSEIQIKAVICLLTVYNYKDSEGAMGTKELGKKLSDANISKNNLSKNLQKPENKKFVRSYGKAGSHNFIYKITPLGIKEGLKILKELISQE